MKINEQTQDISDLMQNFFKFFFFLNTTEPKKKDAIYLCQHLYLFLGGGGGWGGVGCCRVSHNIKI